MKIVIADKVSDYLKDQLTGAGFNVVDVSMQKDLLPSEIKDADGLVVRSATTVDQKLLSYAENLKVIGRPGVGLDNVDVDECKKRGISVFNSPEAPSNSVAEFTIGLIIDLARGISFAHTEMKKKEWPKKKYIGVELSGKTLGVIGTGAIGSIVVKAALALGMNVVGYDVIQNKELEGLGNFRYCVLDKLFQSSDFISLHVPLIPPTKHMIDEGAFGKMKKGVMIINAARGGVVKEEALLKAIRSGIVSRAAIDVFEAEPLQNEELRNNDRVILTPHIGANTKEAQFRNGKIIAEKLIKFFST